MPEPEFFILFVAAGAVFFALSALAAGLFMWGRSRKNSETPKVIAIVLSVCGLVVFAPMLLLLLAWVLYWIFGDVKGPPA